ncbi:hypothetical protein [Tropicibacter alexandrii]|uniref:hypothetical protein n=1 Tax=Tropicibacter alexandrii TaxID=2267683 RepID=UPI0013E8CA2F|nr:hypothetical protein [Tropicibacter alexandrii]
MLDDSPSTNRLARLFALHRTEQEALEEPELRTRFDDGLSDEQIAQWQAAAVASLRR